MGMRVLLFEVIMRMFAGRTGGGCVHGRFGLHAVRVGLLGLDLRALALPVALAAAAGALLAPDFLVYPENGAISTFKGFEIIVIGGPGSLMGRAGGGRLLGPV